MWPAFHSASSPYFLLWQSLNAGLWKQVGQSTKELWKVSTWKGSTIEMCQSANMDRWRHWQFNVVLLQCTLYAVVAFCMCLTSSSVWEAVIHSTWLIPLSGFSFQYFTRDANSYTAHHTHAHLLMMHTVLQLGLMKLQTCITVFYLEQDCHFSISKQPEWNRAQRVKTQMLRHDFAGQ